jgi:hypothetical protein
MTGARWLGLAPLDARVLRATDAYRERTAEHVGGWRAARRRRLADR